MHGFIILLSSIAHWIDSLSISDEILTRIDKIEEVFREVCVQDPDWNKIDGLLKDFPNREETLKSLREDGELLRELPTRWTRERHETMTLLTFVRVVLEFQILKHSELKSEFNNYMEERIEKSD